MNGKKQGETATKKSAKNAPFVCAHVLNIIPFVIIILIDATVD